jgi:ABC-type glutathione transport system ATPase component
MPVQVAEHQVAIDMAEERDIAPSDSTSRPDSRDSTKRENALSRENAINYLLEICAHNNITVTEDLRRAILGEEMNSEVENKVSRRPKYDTRQSLLGGLVRSHQEEHLLEDESELIRDLRSKLERLRRHDAPFEVRIKDGSFKVKTPVEPSGKAGRQHIATVANAGCVYRLRQAARRLLATGSCKQGVEEKHIMEGVNLVLEGGKMYLVLGAPGCGKSTRKSSIIFLGRIH